MSSGKLSFCVPPHTGSGPRQPHYITANKTTSPEAAGVGGLPKHTRSCCTETTVCMGGHKTRRGHTHVAARRLNVGGSGSGRRIAAPYKASAIRSAGTATLSHRRTHAACDFSRCTTRRGPLAVGATGEPRTCDPHPSKLCRASRLSPFTSACLKDDGGAAGQVPRRPLRVTCTNCPCGSLAGKSAAEGTTVFPIQGSAPFQEAALEFRATVRASIYI